MLALLRDEPEQHQPPTHFSMSQWQPPRDKINTADRFLRTKRQGNESMRLADIGCLRHRRQCQTFW